MKLENANCEEVARQVAALFETGETPHKVRWFAPVNAVLLRSTTAEVQQMEGIILALDVPTAKPQPSELDSPKTDIIYLEHATARDLADVVRAHAVPPDGGRRRRVVPLQVLVAERLNSLILKGPESVVSEAKALVTKLDIPIAAKQLSAGHAASATPKPLKAGQTPKRANRG